MAIVSCGAACRYLSKAISKSWQQIIVLYSSIFSSYHPMNSIKYIRTTQIWKACERPHRVNSRAFSKSNIRSETSSLAASKGIYRDGVVPSASH
jgi:hypothetical protein